MIICTVQQIRRFKTNLKLLLNDIYSLQIHIIISCTNKFYLWRCQLTWICAFRQTALWNLWQLMMNYCLWFFVSCCKHRFGTAGVQYLRDESFASFHICFWPYRLLTDFSVNRSSVNRLQQTQRNFLTKINLS